MNNGDVAKILSVGGLAQGVSFIVGMNRVDIMFMMYFGKAENLNVQPYTSQEG